MYEKYLKVVDERAEEICAVSDALWDHPELPYHEFEAAKLLTAKLEENGFVVERGVAGIPTAFTAVYGTKKPVLGVLAEGLGTQWNMTGIGCMVSVAVMGAFIIYFNDKKK